MGNRNAVISSIYAFISISFWGISFVSTKDLLNSLDPYTIITLRFGIATIFLLILIVILKQDLYIKLNHIQYLFILAILGVFIHQLVQASSLLFIDASAAGWLISFSPVFTAILSILFLSERFTLAKLMGMSIAVVGVILVTTHGNSILNFSPNIGYLLMIFSTLNWAVYSILIKKFNLPYSSLTVTFWTSLLGFLLTIPITYNMRGWSKLSSLPVDDWIHLLFLGIFVSAIAYWYWGKALETLEATQVSVLMYLEPLVTLVAAVILLKEKIFLTSVLGGLCIIFGVSIVNKQVLNWIKMNLARK
ncbi:DMT family transporter [Bacillus pinisoli]|uniref:DMT family transporter n=1 Tax=Bacillus pinisoli TaxID=2901866 RepID=UPI001FF51BA7